MSKNLLKTLPGITDANAGIIMANVKNLYELSLMSCAEMAKLIGATNAKFLYEYLNMRNKQ